MYRPSLTGALLLGGSAALAIAVPVAIILKRKWKMKEICNKNTQTLEDIDRIEFLNKKLNQYIQDLELQITELSAAREKEVFELTAKLSEVQKENAELQETLEELEDELTPEAYVNPLLQLEERNHLEEVLSKIKREYEEAKKELSKTKNTYVKEVSALKVKIQVLEKENAKLLMALNDPKKKEEKIELDQKAIETEFALEQELGGLRQTNILLEKEVSHLKNKLEECLEAEAKSSADTNAEINKRKQLEAEVDLLKTELDDAKAALSEQKRLQMEMSTKDVDLLSELEKFRSTNDLAIVKQPSSLALNYPKNLKDEFHKTLLEKQELEEEAEKYKSQARRLSSQYQIIQQRESKQDQQLKECRRQMMEIKRSEMKVNHRYIQGKALLEQKQKLLADMEIKHQLLYSKLARSKREIGYERENAKNLKLSQAEMSQYIDRLVAAVLENCPDLLEKVST